MSAAEIEIRTLTQAGDMATIVDVFQQVWGTSTPIVSVELLMAMSHSGGYVAAVYQSGRVMGASFGFLARHAGEEALHSHVTGVLPGLQHGGIGRAVKQHQREWAAEQGIPWVTWTFDPLIQRNAWFNIEVLGVHVSEYLVNFYGPMTDAINANDESDRLVVAWPTDPTASRPTAPAASTELTIATPDDVVALRRTDPAEALAWRYRVRDQLAPAIAAGGVVVGFTRDGAYTVAVPA